MSDRADLVARLDAGQNFYGESSLWYDRELAEAVEQAARMIEADAAEIERLRSALVGVLDPFHQGQVSMRPEAAGYVQAAIEAGEEALSAIRSQLKDKP